ncbi:GL22871 [Drosophila persimilis]|uniref:GL22871 n=1 Tax=Drosophila persimilis TaxID=7234 RepID=B4GZX0_DROPE|nr:GL22871 [Drosophila persimilis]
MERRKEKQHLLYLQRRQQQAAAKARKEIEASLKREKEREKAEERARQKEDLMGRRAAILKQHRLKKAIAEADREGITLDRPDLCVQCMLARRGKKGSSSRSSSNPSSPKLYRQPAAKSNRGNILNAVEYCILPGAVNSKTKQKVIEKIARSEAAHFLVLFRDVGCQFRALYSYMPESGDRVQTKLYGTGPSQVDGAHARQSSSNTSQNASVSRKCTPGI